MRRLMTSPSLSIYYSLNFLSEYSDVFATCSVNDIRVWNAKSRQELLRIEVPGLESFCINFMQDGRSLSQDGMMERLELSFLNQENFTMPLMTPTITESLL
jgi:hypothetical protein